jgi:hypothetical protein
MPFQTWCIANGYVPNSLAKIPQSIAAYISALPGAVAMCRGVHTAATRANTIYTGYTAVHPAPAFGTPAFGLWKNALWPVIDQQVNALEIQGNQQITQDVQAARIQNAIVSATAPIPSPYDFYRTILAIPVPLAKAHIVGYIDYLLDAINGYITNAVNHSNRRKRVRDAVSNVLQAAKQNAAYLPTDKSIDSGVFDRKIPGAGDGANTLTTIADYWSSERSGTEARMQQFTQACNAVGGAAGQQFNLRRYGSSGEAADIRVQRGFYQKLGISFEQYKWFLDLAVLNATTSVSDTDYAFFVKLKGGAINAIHGIEQEYDADDQPPVIHKPDIGGEVGCFGVHEDCLVAFNTQMVSSIQIKNQKSKKVEAPDVVP